MGAGHPHPLPPIQEGFSYLPNRSRAELDLREVCCHHSWYKRLSEQWER